VVRLLPEVRPNVFVMVLNNFRALAVIGASLALLVLLLGGWYQGRPWWGLGLACFVSFYYGTRS